MKFKHPFARFFMDEVPPDGGAGGGGAPASTPPDGGAPLDTTPPTSGGDTPPEGDGASKPVDFFSSIDEQSRESLKSAGIKDINGLIKNWADAQAYIGSSIRVPSENAGKEDWDKFYAKLQKHAPNLMPKPNKENQDEWNAFLQSIGRPEDPTAYELPQAPEGVDVSEERVGVLRKIAHESGLTKDQFSSMVSRVMELDAQTVQQQQQQTQEQLTQLKAEWGSAFDERNSQVIKMMELTQAPDIIVDMAKKGQVSPDVLKWMYSMSNNFKGEGVNLASDQGGNRKLTPSEAEAQISEIYSNRAHPFFQADHPEHKSAISRMIELQKAANPKASSDPNSLRSSMTAQIPS